MNDEYRRVGADASNVEARIAGRIGTAGTASDTDGVRQESELRLLLPYLKRLQVKHATKVLFVADGAAWIWRRVPSLIKSLGQAPDQVQQRIDFWHAVEYLGKIADSSKLRGRRRAAG